MVRAMPLWVALLLVPVLVFVNAFFVAAEYALVALRPAQADVLPKGRARRAVMALRERPADAIAAIQVCITMSNLLLGWIAEPAVSVALERALGPIARWVPAGVFDAVAFTVGFIVVTLVTVVFGELLPKAVTLKYVPPVALLTALPVLGVRRGVLPLIRVMNALANAVSRPLGLGRVDQIEKEGHTREEVVAMTTQAAADGVLTSAERSLILNALSLGKRKANEIMVSRVRVDYLDLRRTMAENLKVIERQLHSRLPLCDGGMDKVFGVVTTKEFLWAWQGGELGDAPDSAVLQLIARPAVFVPETLTVDKLMPYFHQERTQMLFLVSEYGGVEGIVTLRDVVDEVLRAEGEAAVGVES